MVAAQAGICKNETGASDKDVTDMLNYVAPTTKVTKCLNECILNKLGVVSIIILS